MRRPPPDVHVALQIHQLTLERLNARTPRPRLELRQTLERDHEKNARTRPVDSSRATKSMTCDGGTSSRRFPCLAQVHEPTLRCWELEGRALTLEEAIEHALKEQSDHT